MESNFAALRRFVRSQTDAELCDLCGVELPVEHTHLIEPATRQLKCACSACSILFSGRSDARFKRISRKVTFLSDLRLTEHQWEGLNLPIQLAFFFHNSTEDRLVALYPGPAGATESSLSLDSWKEIVHTNPCLSNLEPDIEALLVNRVHHKHEYFIAPIDECFRLVGLIRSQWRGLSGGTEVWNSIDDFFEQVKRRSSKRSEVANA